MLIEGIGDEVTVVFTIVVAVVITAVAWVSTRVQNTNTYTVEDLTRAGIRVNQQNRTLEITRPWRPGQPITPSNTRAQANTTPTQSGSLPVTQDRGALQQPGTVPDPVPLNAPPVDPGLVGAGGTNAPTSTADEIADDITEAVDLLLGAFDLDTISSEGSSDEVQQHLSVPVTLNAPSIQTDTLPTSVNPDQNAKTHPSSQTEGEALSHTPSPSGGVASVPDTALPSGGVEPVPDTALPSGGVEPVPDTALPSGGVEPVPDTALPSGGVASVPDTAPPSGGVEPVPDTALSSGGVEPVPDTALPSGGVVSVDENSITVKLKFLNDSERVVNMLQEETIGHLRRKAFYRELELGKIVRLIFRGRVLTDDTATLDGCDIHHNTTVHCHITEPPPSAPQQQNTPPGNNNNNNTRPNLLGQIQVDISDGLDIDIFMIPLFCLILVTVWVFTVFYWHHISAPSIIALLSITMVVMLSIGLSRI